MNQPLYAMTIGELAPLIQSKQLSPVELTQSVLHRINEVDKIINSYITVAPEYALRQAQQAEAEIMKGRYRGPLHGIPIAPKDLYYTKDMRTTFGSALYKDFQPNYNATPVDRMLVAGAVNPGKVNLHEFAAGMTNVNVHYGSSRNPWNPDCITGGSSGGSGAAVAGGTAIASLGTDTDGSVRIPSAMCGTYGIKTTYGRVSKHGVKGLSETFTCPGPLARSVEDLALIMNVISGCDPKDGTSAMVPVENYTSYLGKGVKGMKIGYENHFFHNADSEVKQHVKKALQTLESLGAHVMEVSIPELKMAATAEGVAAGAEASNAHHIIMKDPDKRKQLQDDVRIQLETGMLVNGNQYIMAQKARRLILYRFLEVFKKVDAVAGATVPMTAPHFQENLTELNLRVWNRISPYVSPANTSGCPSLSVPVGLSSEGLPIGMQMFGKPFHEGTLFQIGDAYEQVNPFYKHASQNKVLVRN